jgi:hypothetical protein
MADDTIYTFQVTADEYRKLVELTYLGEWIINAQHDPDHQDESAADAVQALLGMIPGKGIDRDAETGRYFLDSDWTDKLYDNYILDYEDHVFWDELTERMAQRDLAQERGVGIEQIDREEDLLALRPIEERYRHELEQNGVERLELNDF